jgi:sugar lactone lactonase YvrE
MLAESPLIRGDELVYIDMLAGVVHRIDLRTLIGSVVEVVRGQQPYVGAVVAVSDGTLAAITVDGVVRVGEGAESTQLVTIVNGGTARLNDAAVDPLGRLWVGSVSLALAPGAGALHVWSPAGGVRTVLDGMTLPNGIGWSPEGSSVYVVDSGPRVLLTAKFDPSTGGIGAFRTLHEFTGNGEPDGLAVAADGTIWVAMWDGSRIDRLALEGTLIESIAVPTVRPTALAFGNGKLFVTTARHGLLDDLLAVDDFAGRVLELDVDVSGAPLGELALDAPASRKSVVA